MADRVRFGAFEFDAERRVLRNHGLRIRVPGQSLEVLAALVAAPGETVPRERIQKLLWPRGTVVGFDQSINTAVKRLREALGDTARTPRFVARVPREGYRFIAPVEALPSPDRDLPPDPAGTLVLHYRLVERVGRGAMGEVWKGEDTRLGRVVALKFIRDDPAGSGDALEAARREARHAASVSHPNICTLHGLEEENGRRFLVMEYVDGRPLTQALSGAPLPADRVFDIGIQAADALVAAHAAGLVHRDLKPANLMIAADGTLKLTDFGIAKVPGAPQTTGTRPGRPSWTGTIEYMSPEQARGEAVDARSDLFSLGVVLYELATGMAAFRGDTPTAVLDAIVHAAPAPPRAANPALPRELERVIDKALEKDVEARWQSASELAAALRAARRASARRARVRRWSVVAVAAAAVSVAAALLVSRYDVPGPPPATTGSPEALKVYRLALAEKTHGDDALPLLQRALELDPEFASAWLTLAQVHFNRGQEIRAEEAIARAYALRGRASEFERLLIETTYHSLATRDYERAIAAGTLAGQLYPRQAAARRAAFFPYCMAGEMDKALELAVRELDLAPDDGVTYFNVAVAELTRGHTREARAALERARARRVGSEWFPFARHVAAVLDGDRSVAEGPVQPPRAARLDARMAALAAQTAGYYGRLSRAAAIADNAETSGEAREVAAVAHATAALMEAVFGRPSRARERARAALRLGSGRRIETSAAFALALSREPGSEAIIDGLLRRYPEDQMLRESWAPALRGAAALVGGRHGAAAAAARTWREDASFGWPGYVKALVDLHAGRPREAEAGFRAILAQKGWLFTATAFYGQAAAFPAAQVGLARALAAEGRTAESRAAYEDFFALWSRADPDVPLLIEARAEYSRLARPES